MSEPKLIYYSHNNIISSVLHRCVRMIMMNVKRYYCLMSVICGMNRDETIQTQKRPFIPQSIFLFIYYKVNSFYEKFPYLSHRIMYHIGKEVLSYSM